jgi:hypothetical protein
MRRHQPQSCPSQERLLSPILVAIFLLLGASAIVFLVDGHPIKLGYLLVLAMTLPSWGEKTVINSIDQFERRHARSPFVAWRLERRSRRRTALRKTERTARRVACLCLSGVVISVGMVVAGAVSGVLPPITSAPAWMQVLRIVCHLLAYMAMVSVGGVLILREAIPRWDQQAESPARSLPIVTSRDFFRAIGQPLPGAVARAAAFLVALILLFLS